MASRRTRTASRPASKITVEPLPDEDTGEEKKDRRRKISMLGPVWNEEELKLFYQAYRKHAKNWKKVAASLHKRTAEMVEALYTVNKAYLSLPDGAASAEGLIAMMTDHYNILDESRSDGVESSGNFGGSDQQNQSRLQSRVGKAASGSAGYGGPSPAKKPRTSRTRAVGKRTPRFPVNSHVDKRAAEAAHCSSQQEPDCETDDDGDDSRVAEAVALTLATASQRVASPQVSQTPNTRTPRKQIHVVPLQNGEMKENAVRTDSGGSFPRQTLSNSGEDGYVESQISKELDNGVVAKASSSVNAGDSQPSNTGGKNMTDSKGRWRKPAAKRLKVQRIEDLDEKEECSRTEGRICHDEENGDVLDTEEVKLTQSQRKKRAAVQRPKKRSRQLFAGDESSGLDRLATLADLSLQSLNGTLPSSTFDSGSDSAGGGVDLKPKAQDLSKESARAGTEQQQLVSPPENRKRKRKLASEKLEEKGELVGADIKEEVLLPQKDVPVVLKPRYKARRAPNTRTLSRQTARTGKLVGAVVSEQEHSSALEPSAEEGRLLARVKSRRKGVPEKIVGGEDNGPSLGLVAHCRHTTPELGPHSAKARLTHCLSTKFRRWCLCEWFYSAIDLPWFARNEFVEYLNHARLGYVPKLTRVEWGVIRSSLGKPRRLSKKFLEEERDKLEKYREKARNHYHELRTGQRDGLPQDLARPLTVGQRVIARHPRTRQIHDGSILTVDRSRCRVQFDRPELGVELVLDIDCMPFHPLENMPEVMRRRRIIVDGLDRNLEDARLDYKSKIFVTAGGAARAALNERLERPISLPAFAPSAHMSFHTLSERAQADSVDSVLLAKAAANEAAAAVQQAVLSQSHTAAQLQAKEADVQALADLTRALDKKEALLVELRRMTDDATGKDVKTCERFKFHCAAIVLQLTDANKQVQAALHQLRRRNRYQDDVVAPWAQLLPQAVIPGNASALESVSESGPSVEDIAASAKKHARFMIATTVQALKDGDETLSKLAMLDFPVDGLKTAEHVQVGSTAAAMGSDVVPALPPGISPASHSNGRESTAIVAAGAACQPAPPADSSTKAAVEQTSGTIDVKSQISDLMASCVATLLLVQATTERQLPTAEVGVAVEKSLVGLRPKMAENHHIFMEIERIVSTIKGQIASQVPQVPMQVSVPGLADLATRT